MLVSYSLTAFIQSWFTAWLTIAGLWLGALSCGMGVAVQIQSYVASASDYTPKTWHAFLVSSILPVFHKC